MNENCIAKPTDNLHHNTRYKYFTNTGPPKRGIRVMASWRLEVSTLSFHAGTAKDRLLGPYFLSTCLTRAVYHDFLQNVLPELLQDVDQLCFMHDNAPTYFLLALWEFLNNVCLEQLIGWGGPTAWPDHSPDLSLGPFKSTVCAAQGSDIQELQQH